MRGNELLDRMDLIDPELLEAADAEPKKSVRIPMGFIATAACFCLLLIGVWMGIRPVSVPTPTEPTDQTNPTIDTAPITEPVETIHHDIQWIPHYNTYGENAAVSDRKMHIPCYFAEMLPESVLESILPAKLPAGLNVTGYAGFSGAAGLDIDAELWTVSLIFTPEDLETELTLNIWKYNYPDCVILDQEPVVSNWYGTDYTLYEFQSKTGMTYLSCEAERGGWFWYYDLAIPTTQIEEGKAFLEAVISSFEAVPDLSQIRPSMIPEFLDEQITHEEALNDPEFGTYFLRQIPQGFTAETLCRYKDYASDLLYGLWCRGYDELYWRVSRISDNDRSRITSAADLENYDLSLYPIPRAESVPEELTEIVNDPIFLAEELTIDTVMARAYKVNDAGDSDGWRMHFSVLYDDILVEVRTKGIDPEWLYGQLISIRDK